MVACINVPGSFYCGHCPTGNHFKVDIKTKRKKLHKLIYDNFQVIQATATIAMTLMNAKCSMEVVV